MARRIPEQIQQERVSRHSLTHQKIIPSTKAALSATELGKAFRASDFVFRYINFEIAPGEIVALVGRSGMGKTTLLNILAGFISPTEGYASTDGQVITEPGSDRTVVFQRDALFPWLTVWDNAAFGLRHQQQRYPNEESRISTLLERVGLAAFTDFYPRQLSGGMQKRAELARAFAAEPSILLADEPFSSNDEVTRLELHQLLLEEWKRSKTTILITTHDLEEAVFLSNRVLILEGIPANISRIIEVPFPYPRHPELLQNPSFQELRAQIYRWITASPSAHPRAPKHNTA